MIAEVIVDVNCRQVNHPFDYQIPPEFLNILEKGMRVKVPFRTRMVMGYVVNIKETSTLTTTIKDIAKVLDVIPILDDELMNLAWEMAAATNSFVVKCIETMLPLAMRGKYQKRIIVNNRSQLPIELSQVLKRDSVLFNDSLANYLPLIKSEIKKGNLFLDYEVKDALGVKTNKMLQVIDDSLAKTEQQKRVIQYIRMNDNEIEKDKLIRELGCQASLNSLISKGAVQERVIEKYREINFIEKPVDKVVELDETQKDVVSSISKKLGTASTFLLHGITGSGKTEIYLHIAEKVIQSGKEVIILVPEISLTPQMIHRFKGRFHTNVAILHSGLSVGERYDEWRKVLRKEVKIALGARSAIFAPFTNLGIIIIDEEHEASYRQSDDPKYDSVEVAMLRAKNHCAPVILGSATPLVEHYQRALNGEFILLEMLNRANGAQVPSVEVVSMTEELASGNKMIFSRLLKNEISTRLARNEQVILLLNKRGYSSFVLCRECGETIKCPHCDITLTYHQKDDSLRCHYCGYRRSNVRLCPQCKSEHVRYMGLGTEKVVEQLNRLWPTARVLRMDADTTSTKGAHEAILSAFGRHDADVLVGTQMIAKGLDFPNVTLVGVLMADFMLKLPDFRSAERTFQLVSQVIGRAGRHEKKGIAVVQTYNEKHYSICCATTSDYTEFYKQEMQFRKLGKYAPYWQMIQLIISYADYDSCIKEAQFIYRKLRSTLSANTIIFEPTPALIVRINDKYRLSIIIKHQNDLAINSCLDELVLDYQNSKYQLCVDKNAYIM